jgi:integrase
VLATAHDLLQPLTLLIGQPPRPHQFSHSASQHSTPLNKIKCGKRPRSKGRRQDRLPLTVEAGDAIADYLTGGRPSSPCPRVILTLYAPYRGIHPSSITRVAYRACQRAGLPRVGGHRLRRALASEMLRQGSDLVEISRCRRRRRRWRPTAPQALRQGARQCQWTTAPRCSANR